MAAFVPKIISESRYLLITLKDIVAFIFFADLLNFQLPLLLENVCCSSLLWSGQFVFTMCLAIYSTASASSYKHLMCCQLEMSATSDQHVFLSVYQNTLQGMSIGESITKRQLFCNTEQYH